RVPAAPATATGSRPRTLPRSRATQPRSPRRQPPAAPATCPRSPPRQPPPAPAASQGTPPARAQSRRSPAPRGPRAACTRTPLPADAPTAAASFRTRLHRLRSTRPGRGRCRRRRTVPHRRARTARPRAAGQLRPRRSGRSSRAPALASRPHKELVLDTTTGGGRGPDHHRRARRERRPRDLDATRLQQVAHLAEVIDLERDVLDPGLLFFAHAPGGDHRVAHLDQLDAGVPARVVERVALAVVADPLEHQAHRLELGDVGGQVGNDHADVVDPPQLHAAGISSSTLPNLPAVRTWSSAWA